MDNLCSSIFLCPSAHPQFWEYCIPHNLNCVSVCGFGVPLDKAKSRNVECRDLFGLVRQVVEYLKTSDKMKVGRHGCLWYRSSGSRGCGSVTITPATKSWEQKQ